MVTTTFPDEQVIISSLSRAWWPVALVEQFNDDPKKAYPITLLDLSLVVYRGESGHFYVADRRCPHRGASLALGCVSGDAIACPYHGWEWDGSSGRCTRIPALGADQRRVPGVVELRIYPTVTRWGLVWTCLNAQPESGLVDPPELHAGTWQFATRISEQETNLLFSMENFLDVAHFPFVHTKTFGKNMPAAIEKLNVERDGHEVVMRVRMTSTESDGYPDLIYPASQATLIYRAYPPGVIFAYGSSDGGGLWILMHCVSPVSLECTRAFRVIAVSEARRHLLEEFVQAEDVVYEEDRAVAGSLTPRRLGAPLQQASTAADAYTLAFRRAFCEWLDVQKRAIASLSSQSARS
jgi:nitrite reductase/ring-hydroxylating ferredoxin subunit